MQAVYCLDMNQYKLLLEKYPDSIAGSNLVVYMNHEDYADYFWEN